MSLTLHTAAERPDLWERGIDSVDVWPEYNLHGDVLNQYWGRLDVELADFQFVLHDEDTDEVVAEGQVWAGGTRLGRYAATVFPGPKNNIVFNASTIFWSQGLASPPGHMLPFSHFSRPHGPDPRVQRMTANALTRALAGKRA